MQEENHRLRTWHRNYLTSHNIEKFRILNAGYAAKKRGTIKGYFDIKPNVRHQGKKSRKM